MGIVSEFFLLSLTQVYISTTMADSSKDVTPSSTQRVPTTHRDLFFEDPHFKDNWHNFDKIRDSMFKESRDLWKQMDKDFRKMRCMNPMLTADEGEEEKSAPVAKYEDSWRLASIHLIIAQMSFTFMLMTSLSQLTVSMWR